MKISFGSYDKRLILFALQVTITLFLFGVLSQALSGIGQINDITDSNTMPSFVFVQKNSLSVLSNPTNPAPRVVKKLPVVVTAYSSTPSQTDDSPFVTASGSYVRDGVIANNYLPFGTRVRIPEIYGDKVFVVEDRMNYKKGNYHVDVWFSDYWQALGFGVKRTTIEVLEG
jgi:3D (Asp-Asp-Asp) domain-containing protein